MGGHLIEIGPDDSESPTQWSTKKRILHTVGYACTTLCAQFNATSIAPGIPDLAFQFHVGTKIATLAMSVFILGNGLGPLLFAPLSEAKGRKVGVLIPFMISSILTMIVACVDSMAAVVVLRFFAGVFAAAPIVSTGAAMADLWPAEHRAAALVLYAVFILTGATFGPVIGALLESTGPYGWRWSCWLGGIAGFVISFTNFCALSETYRPVLAAQKARKIRLTMGNWEAHAKHDEWELTTKEFLRIHCARPIYMFSTPVVCAMATFSSFVYGLIYLVIASVGENFQRHKGFAKTTCNLPLIAVFVGFLFGGAANLYSSQLYATLSKQGKAVPEHRLLAMIGLCWTVPAGCFIFGWTLSPAIHWIVPCTGLALLGCGMVVVLQGCINYIVDCFPVYGASGIATYTVLRSVLGGVFSLFASQLFTSLGMGWGSSVMGFISVALLPAPFIYYTFGAKLRHINPFEDALT